MDIVHGPIMEKRGSSRGNAFRRTGCSGVETPTRLPPAEDKVKA
jgi:hypothetical protein